MYYPEEMKARVGPVQWSKPNSKLSPTQDSNQGGRIQNHKRWPLHYHCTLDRSIIFRVRSMHEEVCGWITATHAVSFLHVVAYQAVISSGTVSTNRLILAPVVVSPLNQVNFGIVWPWCRNNGMGVRVDIDDLVFESTLPNVNSHLGWERTISLQPSNWHIFNNTPSCLQFVVICPPRTMKTYEFRVIL